MALYSDGCCRLFAIHRDSPNFPLPPSPAELLNDETRQDETRPDQIRPVGQNWSELGQDWVRTWSGLNQDIDRTLPGPSQDFPTTFLGLLSQKFFRTFSGLSMHFPDIPRTFPGLSQDFLRTISGLSQKFLRSFFKNFFRKSRIWHGLPWPC